MNGELVAIFDKAEARSEKEASQAMPPREGEKLEQTMDRLYDWHHELPKAGRVRQSTAYQELQSKRDEAKNFGITPEHAELIRQNDLLRQQMEQGTRAAALPQELAQPMQVARQLYPQMKYAEVSSQLLDHL